MFGKPVGDRPARAHGRRLDQKSPARRISRRNRSVHAIFGATLSAALLASMTFSGGVLPAFATSSDPVATESAISVEETTDEVEIEQIEEENTPPVAEPSGANEEIVQSSPEPLVEEQEEAAPTADPEPQPEASKETAQTEEASEPSAQSLELGDEELGFAPLALGPDGASAPYVYWNVVDEDRNPVAGATFSFERRNNNSWTGQRNVSDCATGSCAGVDRDHDGGEFLAKWIGYDIPGVNPVGTTITGDGRYRVRPANPPTGYTWVSSTGWVDSVSQSWAGPASSRTLNFGTFTVREVSYAPVCEAGYVYGLTANGQIRAVSPGGTVTSLGGTVGQPSMAMNGLGIGSGGSPVFAYSRTNSNGTATIYRFDVTTGTWTGAGANVNSNTDGRTVQFVAGAVNLETGRYYLGGYNTSSANDRVFRIWEYTPGATSAVYKGHISTPRRSGEPANALFNGDMAFDANGNLFVIRGTGNQTTVYSVTAENLAAANGGVIPSSGSEPFATMDSVNGIAFDANGKGYLSSSSTVRSYDMPGWTNSSNVTTDLNGSTDLASCGSPPTIEIEKFVEGGRVKSTDQFKLTLRQGAANGTIIGEATTTGNENGLQGERVGPLPTVRNVQLHFAETAVGGTNLNDYASSYRCLVDGVQANQGNGTSGTITIPAGGQAVECRFYNSPLIAQVNVHKQVTDSQGGSPKPGEGWTVGASAQPTTGTITSTPAAATQQTNSEGTASWRLGFGASNHVANLNVTELMQDGYEFDNGTCEVTKLDGTTTTTALTGPSGNPALGIVPGDVVDCTFVNSLKPASVTVGKELLDFTGQDPQPAEGWTVGAALASGGTSGVTVSTPATAQTQTNGRVATPWVVHFPSTPNPTGNVTVQETMQDGYEFVSGTCVITSDNGTETERSIESASQVLTGLKPGDAAECMFTNKPKTGTVIWQKVDEAGGALAGSEWLLTGPGAFNGGEPLAVVDCIEDSVSECTGADRNPEAGAFELLDLPWGNYELEETKSPAGYYLIEKQPIKFELVASQLSVELEGIVNKRMEGPSLPLTGGLGRDFYAILGGGILLIGLVSFAIVMLRRRHQEVA